MKNFKKLTRNDLKKVGGGNAEAEGTACYCGGQFKGYTYNAEGCWYACTGTPVGGMVSH